MPLHSGPEIKLNKLMIFFPMHIFSNPIRKGKMSALGRILLFCFTEILLF